MTTKAQELKARRVSNRLSRAFGVPGPVCVAFFDDEGWLHSYLYVPGSGMEHRELFAPASAEGTVSQIADMVTRWGKKVLS